jgi:hypothetical protein
MKVTAGDGGRSSFVHLSNISLNHLQKSKGNFLSLEWQDEQE